jgi:hypothetical protein
MSGTPSAFVSELLRSANEVDRLTKPDQARLLERAAATIREYQEQINYPETPDEGEDIVYCLSEMARLIGSFANDEVAETILEAAETINQCQMLLEARPESD